MRAVDEERRVKIFMLVFGDTIKVHDTKRISNCGIFFIKNKKWINKLLSYSKAASC
jgi:hypothetical protein